MAKKFVNNVVTYYWQTFCDSISDGLFVTKLVTDSFVTDLLTDCFVSNLVMDYLVSHNWLCDAHFIVGYSDKNSITKLDGFSWRNCPSQILVVIGPKFTWTNYRDPRNIIRTRIDKAHATVTWIHNFLETKVTHHPRIFSDHCPILLRTQPNHTLGPKPFIFEVFWMDHPSFEIVTSNIWLSNSLDLNQTIHNYQLALTS